MTEFEEFPDNVIPVDFKIKRISRPDAEPLSSNLFAGFIDECLLEPDDVVVEFKQKRTCRD